MTGIQLQNSRKRVKAKLARLEDEEGVAAEVAIQTGMFDNKAGTDARADIVGEQVACSLSELQEEAEGLEEAFQAILSIMGQEEERRTRSEDVTD